jgi:2-polyprenyl-6-methoxyphenol hydroxylase-like FAD-dependent oxidoreductase
MTSPEMTDVLVIGAGPVGLTLACELKRHGAVVRIIDRKAEPNPHPNAAVVHVRTLEILAAMGAVEGFLKEGYAFPGMHVHVFGKRIGFINISGIDSPYPVPRTLGQQITERLLNEHLERLGGRVERAVEAVGLEQDAKEVRVRLQHLAQGNREEIGAARWVVGCEGSPSITRQVLNIPFPGERYPGKEFLQVDANVRWTYPHGYGYQFLADEHILLLFPYNDTGHYRIICARNDRDPENHEPPTLAEMQELVQKIADPAAELYDPVWRNRFRSGHRLAGRFREGRAFLAGDAGHVHVPIGGQGMNYGMHDAFNLGWKLAAVAKGEARPELLDTYEAERHPADEALIRGTDFGFHQIVQLNAASRLALQLLAPTILNLEAVQKRMRNILAEMNVAYPTSKLSEDHGGSHGPVAGDRAPDAPVVRMPDRRTARLFDVLHDPRWALLLFAGAEPTAEDIEALEKISCPLSQKYGTRLTIHLILCGDPPVPVHQNWAADFLMDRERYLHDKYGVDTEPCLYLIRPDWHIAFRGGKESARKLGDYLERVLGAVESEA